MQKTVLVNAGDAMRAEQHNLNAKAIRDLQRRASYAKPEWPDMFVAKIMTAGPDSESDYSDARYWVKEVYCSDSSGTISSAITLAEMTCDPSGGTGWGRYVTATNLAELADDTHSLDSGTYVRVEALYDSQTPGVVRYFFTRALPSSGSGGLVKITTSTSPMKGDVKEGGGAMSSWDDNSGSHYSVTDEGNGEVNVGDIYPGFKDSSDVWHIASVYHRLKDIT